MRGRGLLSRPVAVALWLCRAQAAPLLPLFFREWPSQPSPNPLLAPLPAGELGRLAAVLDRLEPHAADVNAVGGAGAWEAGGGVYSAYLYLKVGELSFICCCCIFVGS